MEIDYDFVSKLWLKKIERRFESSFLDLPDVESVYDFIKEECRDLVISDLDIYEALDHICDRYSINLVF